MEPAANAPKKHHQLPQQVDGTTRKCTTDTITAISTLTVGINY
jgi:hypothetical protein